MAAPRCGLLALPKSIRQLVIFDFLDEHARGAVSCTHSTLCDDAAVETHVTFDDLRHGTADRPLELAQVRTLGLSHREDAWNSTLTCAELAWWSPQLKQLLHLDLSLGVANTPPLPPLPCTLQTLRVALPHQIKSGEAWLSSIGNLSRLHTLQLRPCGAGFDLVGLPPLPALKRLEVRLGARASFKDGIRALAAYPRLAALDIAIEEAHLLSLFCFQNKWDYESKPTLDFLELSRLQQLTVEMHHGVYRTGICTVRIISTTREMEVRGPITFELGQVLRGCPQLERLSADARVRLESAVTSHPIAFLRVESLVAPSDFMQDASDNIVVCAISALPRLRMWICWNIYCSGGGGVPMSAMTPALEKLGFCVDGHTACRPLLPDTGASPA